jgi:large subunit ribosomal protein L13
VDADGQVLGRLAARIAQVLRGRHKPTYTPHVDTGDFVVVLNAAKVRVTGRKETDKQYMFFTGWVGREKYRNVAHFRKHRPEFLIMHAVKGMLPKNRLASKILTKLKVYPGANHPHDAQQPQPFPI